MAFCYKSDSLDHLIPAVHETSYSFILYGI